jgi:hypothetical protein
MPYILFLSILLSLSSPLFNIVGIAPNLLFSLLLIVAILLSAKSGFRSLHIIYALGILLSSTIAAYFAETMLYAKYSIYLCLSLLATSSLSTEQLAVFSRTLDKFIISGLLLSCISAALFFLHQTPPIFEVQNPDGRPNGLYYFTFSNWVLGPVIRPSFLFDEPGAFSFVICSAVLIRDAIGSDKKMSFWMLFLGLITFSPAQFIVFILFTLSNFEYIFGENRKKARFFFTCLGIVVSSFFYGFSEELSFFTQRFEWIEGEGFAGDNRSGQIERFFEIVDRKMFLYGLPDCLGAGADCSHLGDLSSNPFTPISSFGFIFSHSFYLLILFLSATSILGFHRFHSMVILLLLLQRPYLYSYGYSLLVVLALFPLFERRNVPPSL